MELEGKQKTPTAPIQARLRGEFSFGHSIRLVNAPQKSPKLRGLHR
jgi:hypothetical protein